LAEVFLAFVSVGEVADESAHHIDRMAGSAMALIHWEIEMAEEDIDLIGMDDTALVEGVDVKQHAAWAALLSEFAEMATITIGQDEMVGQVDPVDRQFERPFIVVGRANSYLLLELSPSSRP
jgi:hypothetical protein